jgi:uncharacterized phage protein (TIGR02220 family)
MFAKTIIDSDAFLDMPLTTQALYFHLSMRADDDGFLNNPMKVLRMVGCNKNDLDLLIAKRFLLSFDNGIVVVKHWRIHNYIQKDRYKETVYIEEKKQLQTKDNGTYTLGDTECIQNGYSLEAQVRLGKDRLEEGKDIDIILGDEHPTECHIPYSRIIDYLNAKTGSSYKSTSVKTQTLIKTRINERFTEQDFYTVIDNKVATWLNDPKMNKYLRPETLFGTKFEGYLNEKGGSNGQNSSNNQQDNPGKYDTSKIMYNGPGLNPNQEIDF